MGANKNGVNKNDGIYRKVENKKTFVKKKTYGISKSGSDSKINSDSFSGESKSKSKPNESNFVNEDNFLEGRNAVLEALKSGKPINSLLVKKGVSEGTLKVIIALAKEKDIVIKEMVKDKLDSLSAEGKHQGVIAILAAHEYVEISDILRKGEEKGEPAFIIILDGITDPHNLGAIIRTANAAGVHGIIIPKRRGAGLTPIVGKTSAGAVHYVPVARVSNITNAIIELKKRNIWVACSDAGGRDIYSAGDYFTEPLAIVIGNEGKGVSRLVRENCDFSIGIPMVGEIASLNASVASSIIIYEILRRRLGGK